MSNASPAADPFQADSPAPGGAIVDVLSLPTPAAAFDSAHRILTCNHSFAELTNSITRSAHSTASLIKEGYPPLCEVELPLCADVETVATTGQPTPARVITLNAGTPTEQWLQIQCCPCREHQDHLAATLVQIVDITDAISRSRLRGETSDEPQNITSRICHDLMAPVSTARGLLGIAEDDANEGVYDEIPEMLRDAGIQLVRLDRLIRDFSALSRTDRPSDPPSELQIDLLLEQWCHQQQRTTPDIAAHTVRSDLNITTLTSEATRVQEIMSALLHNATTFVDPGEPEHHIQVSTRRQGSSTVIEVSDNGPGIEPGMQSTLFELFARGTSEQCGNGLGLHIAWKHLMHLGGSIRLTHHCKPTTFEVTIPDADPQSQGA